MAESEIHLEPNPSFDWSRVLWGAPNATISDDCSYCGACIPRWRRMILTGSNLTEKEKQDVYQNSDW